MADKKPPEPRASVRPRTPAKGLDKKTEPARPAPKPPTGRTPAPKPDVSTEGRTASTAHDSSDALPETETFEKKAESDSPPAKPSPPKTRAKAKKSPGRVSLVTLHNGVIHRQHATGVDLLQEALGLPPNGYPDDALDAAIAQYRSDHDLGGGGVDLTLLESLGFDVVTV